MSGSTSNRIQCFLDYDEHTVLKVNGLDLDRGCEISFIDEICVSPTCST